MKIIIPARKDSKGLPFKNRKLFKYTADIVPDHLKKYTYVNTDDCEIINMAEAYGFNVWFRKDELGFDTTSTKEVIVDMMDNFETSDIFVMLYLTYPERTWEDVMTAYEMFCVNNVKSLLCKKEIETSPFLMLKEESDNRGSQLFHHDLYRRQDYPKCFEISHYISIFMKTTINNLNNNMYNIDTIYMEIPNDTIDVDTQKDLDRL